MKNIIENAIPLMKMTNNFHSNYIGQANAILLIYKNISIQDIVRKVIYSNLMYKSKQKRYISKVSKYIINKSQEQCFCLLFLKNIIDCMAINNLDIDGIKGQYYYATDTREIEGQLKTGEWVEDSTKAGEIIEIEPKMSKGISRANLQNTMLGLKERLNEIVDYIKSNNSADLNQSLEKINWDLLTTVANMNCISNSIEFLHSKIDMIEEKIKSMKG